MHPFTLKLNFFLIISFLKCQNKSIYCSIILRLKPNYPLKFSVFLLYLKHSFPSEFYHRIASIFIHAIYSSWLDLLTPFH